MPGAQNYEISYVNNQPADHINIYDSSTVIDGIESELDNAFLEAFE